MGPKSQAAEVQAVRDAAKEESRSAAYQPYRNVAVGLTIRGFSAGESDHAATDVLEETSTASIPTLLIIFATRTARLPIEPQHCGASELPSLTETRT